MCLTSFNLNPANMTKVLFIAFALMLLSDGNYSQPKYKLSYEDEMRILNDSIEVYKNNVKWAQHQAIMVIKQSNK